MSYRFSSIKVEEIGRCSPKPGDRAALLCGHSPPVNLVTHCRFSRRNLDMLVAAPVDWIC
jgi:hypothetical protein